MFRHAALRLALAVVAVTVVVAVVAALVGGDDRTFVPSSAVAQAAETTQQVPGASIDMRGTMTIDGLDEPMHFRMSGVQDTAGKSAHMTGEYTDMPAGTPGKRDDGSIPIASIVVMPNVYMKSPIFSAGLPDGKSWMSYDVVEVGKQFGTGDPTRFGQDDPMATVKLLRASGNRVEKVGTERVRGVSTTHYRGKVELRKLPDTMPAAQRAEARKGIERLIDLIGTDSYPVEVWVDRRHLLRRMRMQMQMKIAQVDKTMKMDISMDLFDFGRKPKAKAPPKDDVYDVTDQAAAAAAKQQGQTP
jgi:hypothetical protein